MQQLSGLDASLLYMDRPSTPNHVMLLYTYDPSTAAGGRVAFDDVLHNVERRLALSRTFRQKLVRVPLELDFPYWVEGADFDLEFHVQQVSLPAPGTWRQLMDVVASIHARPIDLSRPPWELHFIEGLADGTDDIPHSGFAVLIKLHHAAVDGVSGVELLTVLHDHAPDAGPPALDDDWRPEADPSSPALLRKAVVNHVVKPWHLVRVVRRAAPAVPRVVGGVRRGELQASRPEIPRTRFNMPVTAHRTMGARRVPLAALKAARKAVDGATVNDVVLTVVGGALRRYLAARDDLPELPLVVVIPVSTRTVDEQGSGGNQVGTLTSTLATDIADPIARLAAVKAGTENVKKMNEAVSARTMSDLSNAMPGVLIGIGARAQSALSARNRGRLLSNTTVSNVPGPSEQLYFCGARLVGPYLGAQVFHGSGLTHTATSSSGQFTLAFIADRELLPDPEDYEHCIANSFRELFEATA